MSFTNEDRTRHYGLRVGDEVTETAFGHSVSGTVLRLHLTDNNGCTARTDRGDITLVCEWCTITKKVEDNG